MLGVCSPCLVQKVHNLRILALDAGLQDIIAIYPTVGEMVIIHFERTELAKMATSSATFYIITAFQSTKIPFSNGVQCTALYTIPLY